MNNIKRFLKQIKEDKSFQFKIGYRFPYTFLILTHPTFTEDDEENEIKLCAILNIEIQYIRDISNLSLLSLECLPADDFKKREIKNRGTYWSELRIEEELNIPNEINEKQNKINVVHFFGYKGGQGRSSVMTALSLSLMKLGWKVLVIDADFEAPSLDLIYNKTLRLENSLLGLYLGEQISAINYDSKFSGGGLIDILGAKPSVTQKKNTLEIEDEWSIEYSAMTLQTNVNPATIQLFAEKIKAFYMENKYDIILIDHRSGMSISSISWMKQLEGQLVLFIRLDNQWKHSYEYIRSMVLNSQSNDVPVISQKPYMTKDLAQIENNFFEKQKEDLKVLFAKNKQVKEKLSPEDISDGDINANFLDWQYDPVYRDNLLPDTEQILGDNLKVLQKIRDILQLESDKNITIKSSKSGVDDEGLLIVTDALNKLLNKNNDYFYIYGRKGTGKTKIFTELVNRRIAKPLIAQSDFFSNRIDAEGINGESDTMKKIIRSFNEKIKILDSEDPDKVENFVENFWWCILLTAMEIFSTKRSILNKALEEEFDNKFRNFKKESANYSNKLKDILKEEKEKIIFCIDGLETTFQINFSHYYIEALYRVMSTIETDSYFEKLQVKLFLRKDLKPESQQNLEQKGSIELIWTEQAILNFFVSRLLANTEGNRLRKILYDKNDMEKLNNLIEVLARAEVSIEECINILKTIFPTKIGSGNSKIDSFFLSYFTDTESSLNIPYYPRVYQDFIKKLNSQDIKKDEIIIKVYEDVAKEYLISLKNELNFLLEFDDNPKKNDQLVRDFILSFKEERTPFDRMKLIISINKKMHGDIKFREKVGKAFDSMKNMGIFEETQKDKNRWRVGRLVKAAFGMIYDK